jgi:protein-S-isoprenylcysteine O-methyltransferase Ste14
VPDAIFRFVLPLYGALGLLGLGLRRAAIRRTTGVDPIVARPLRGDTLAAHLERAFAAGFLTLNADIVLNAVAPQFAADRLAVPLLRESVIVGWVGLAVMTAGLLLGGAAIWGMGASWRVGVDRDHPGPLVTTGLYAHMRHPIYTGVLLLACGAAAVTADLLSIAVAVASLIGLPVQARLEEDFLTAQYGAAYTEYAQRTRRF